MSVWAKLGRYFSILYCDHFTPLLYLYQVIYIFSEIFGIHERSLELVKTLSEEDANVVKCFLFQDFDKDGFVEKDELKLALKALGYFTGDEGFEKRFEHMMKNVDTDEDGKINFEEFKKANMLHFSE